MLCNDAPLIAQRIWHNVLSPQFPNAASSVNLLKAHSLLGEHLIFFSMIFKLCRV